MAGSGSLASTTAVEPSSSSMEAILHLPSFEEGIAIFAESKSDLTEEQLKTVLEVS